MYDGNSLAIGWQDIRDLGYRDWNEYEKEIQKEEEQLERLQDSQEVL